MRSWLFISCLLQDSADRGAKLVPLFGFQLQLLAAGRRQAIEAGSAAEFGYAPFRFDPTLMFQAMEGWIQRTLIHLENFLRDLLNPFRGSPTVHRAVLEGSQDQEIEGALEQVETGTLGHGVDGLQQEYAGCCRM